MSLVNPITRNLKFELPVERVSDWHVGGVHVSLYLNTMSLFFPPGERFFIDSVRHYREKISDPVLNEDVRAFIGQEAMHGREHNLYNDAMEAAGFPVKKMERSVLGRLNRVRKYTSPAYCLAVTIALEHLTAILAESLLASPDALRGSEPRYTALWQWHALEETEHKAVAFDVYQAVHGTSFRAYFRRCVALVVSTTIFCTFCSIYFIKNLKRKRVLTDFRGWGALIQYLWLRPGVLRKAVPAWFSWFKPGFHPWDHDNRKHLELIDDLVLRVDSFGQVHQQVA